MASSSSPYPYAAPAVAGSTSFVIDDLSFFGLFFSGDFDHSFAQSLGTDLKSMEGVITGLLKSSSPQPAARRLARPHAAFSALLLLSSECLLSPLRADVAQQALSMPSIAQQVLWYVRADALQRAIGVQFAELQLLRRAFVHPSYGDKPEVATREVGHALSRCGTLRAQQAHARTAHALRAARAREAAANARAAMLARGGLAPLTAAVKVLVALLVLHRLVQLLRRPLLPLAAAAAAYYYAPATSRWVLLAALQFPLEAARQLADVAGVTTADAAEEPVLLPDVD